MANSATCGKRGSDEIQPFPQKGRLMQALNLDLTALREFVPLETKDVYCYIVASIKCRNGHFIQTGTAPNFQGGIVTLCTCKHQMRSWLGVNSWPGQWIAGFTGIDAVDRGNYLVYLMKVSEAFASHQELWWSKAVPAEAKKAKAADLHRGGDMYRPRSRSGDPYDPRSYVAPRTDHSHAQNDEWHNDIDYKKRRQRPPPLLVGDPRLSFLWDRPAMRLPFELQRNPPRPSLRHLLEQLEAPN